MKKKNNEFLLEECIKSNVLYDVSELRRKYQLSTEQMDKAILDAQKRGFPIYCVNGRLFQAKTRMDLEARLYEVRDSYHKRSMKTAVSERFTHRDLTEENNK